MPLAPASLIDQWYHRSSWTFKNFAFLFQNPLWTKKVPQGFSLCPFFWLSLFSLFIFRPMVYALLGLGAAIRALHLERVIKQTDRFGLWVLREDKDRFPSLIPTLIMLSFAVIISMIASSVVQWGIECWAAGAFPAFVLPVFLASVFFPSLLYRLNHMSSPCKVEAYSRLATVVSVVAAFVFYSAGAYEAFVLLPWNALVGIGAGIVWLASFAWWGITTAASWLVSCILTYQIWAIASLAFAAFAAVYGWVVYRWFPGTLGEGSAKGTIDHKERLRELAERFYYRQEMSYGSRHWYIRLFLRLEDRLLAYLESVNWDIEEAYAKLRSELKDEIAAEYRREQERRAAREAKCQRVTAALSKLLYPISWAFNQFRIACAYGWVLVKAKKQGACPYILFKD